MRSNYLKYSKNVEGHMKIFKCWTFKEFKKMESYLGLYFRVDRGWCVRDGSWQMMTMAMIIVWQSWWWIRTTIATPLVPSSPGCAVSSGFISFWEFQHWGNPFERPKINVFCFCLVIYWIVVCIGCVVWPVVGNWLKHIALNWEHFGQQLFCFLG